MASASISSDAELMWNVLPAVALPSQSKFLTARDRNGNPMIFGIGTDAVLRVAQEDPQTRLRQLIDLHPKLGLPEDAKTNGFDMLQATDDSIYLSLTYATASEARLLALQPFYPKEVDFTSLQASLPTFRSTRLDQISSKDVLLGPLNPSVPFPSIIVSYNKKGTGYDNVKRFEVSPDSEAIENRGDLSLPVNASSIIGLAAGKIKRHHGVFVLYSQNNTPALMFTSYSDQFDTNIECPEGAGYISTITNDKGDTDLVVGGNGISHFASQDLLYDSAQGVKLCDGPNFRAIYDMLIAQDKTRICIWATTGEKGVSYLELDPANVRVRSSQAAEQGVPLLAAGKGGGIAGFVGSDGRNAVLISDAKSQMVYFEQSYDTLMWRQTPFWFPSPQNTIKIYSYMTRIVAHDKVGAPIPGAWIKLNSTGWVDVVINGAPCKVGQAPIMLQTDSEGALNVINPTTDISSYQFAVSEIRGMDYSTILFNGDPTAVNPMAKVDKALSGMTAQKLSDATASDGKPIFEGCTKEQFEQAAGALGAIESAKASIDSVNNEGNAVVPLNQKPQMLTVRAAGMGPGDLLSNIKNVLWDCWQFVVSSYDKIKAWVVETYESVKTFVIHIGEQAYRFVLDSAIKIAKAANFIYTQYLKAPLERLVDWFRNLFSWGDIVETKNNIVDFINATLDYGEQNLVWAADKVDNKFDTWKGLIRNNLSPKNIPMKIKDKRVGPKSQDGVDHDIKEKIESADVKQNWTKYQLTHGGALHGSVIDDAVGVVLDEHKKTWDTIVKPCFESLTDTVNNISDDILLFFNKNKEITPGDILEKMGVDILLGILDAVKTLLVGVLKRLSLIVGDFKDLINKKIKVPIFSDLWVYANKMFNKDVEAPTFTVIGFVGFLLAIPITLTSKLFTGKKPPSLPKFNVKSLTKVFDESAPASDKLSYNGFAAMLEAAASSTLAVVGVFSVIGAGGALAAIFDFQMLFGLVRVAVCWPTRKDLPAWELRCAISSADAVNVFILAIARKVDKGGSSEKVLAVIEGAIALLNIGMHTAVNVAELIQDWNEKDEDRTTNQILISILSGVSTVGKCIATASTEPTTKLGGTVAKTVAGKASGFFNVVNTYGNIGKGKYTFILNSGS